MIALKWLGITAAALAALALFIVDYAVTGGLGAVAVAGVGLAGYAGWERVREKGNR